MRQIPDYPLWVGHLGDLRGVDDASLGDIRAVVELAVEERPQAVTRELIYCRFPLVDGAGNPRSELKAATAALVSLLDNGIPTLVYCRAGMSRSVCIAAAAISRLRSCSLHDALVLVSQSGPVDVSAGLFADIEGIMA